MRTFLKPALTAELTRRRAAHQHDGPVNAAVHSHQMHSPRLSAQRRAIQRLVGRTDDASPPSRSDSLPAQLRGGLESLSGLDLSDVRVHRNSGQAAQLNALAYAQGADIHLGPGQEQHLPHEAWHVVQQRQGRVKPTLRLGAVEVNDDPALEREADTMGARASSGNRSTSVAPHRPALQRRAAVLQCKLSQSDAVALFVYYDQNYSHLIERRTYLEGLHRQLVLGYESLEDAKDALDEQASRLVGREVRGSKRAPKGFAPVFNDVEETQGSKETVDSTPPSVLPDRMLGKANTLRRNERANLFCIVKFDGHDNSITDYESGKSRRGPLSMRYKSADAEQRMVADFPKLLERYGGMPRSVTVITSASPCNRVCLPLLLKLIDRYAGQIQVWDFSFFEPYFMEDFGAFVNTIHSLNLVTAGSNGRVTVSRAGLLPQSAIEHGAISSRGTQGREDAQEAVAKRVTVIDD
jgi:hypothetical protein